MVLFGPGFRDFVCAGSASRGIWSTVRAPFARLGGGQTALLEHRSAEVVPAPIPGLLERI